MKECVYKETPQGELKVHVFFPPDWKEGDRRPGIIFFFGGGWSIGAPQQFFNQAGYFAERGMVAASAEYRIKSKHDVAPDKCVEDARTAIRWFRSHADELGLDPDRIVGSGGSAGAHLAACAGTGAGRDDEGDDLSVSAKPNALVLFNPAMSFVGREKMLERIGGDEKLAELLSPTVQLTEDDPPALLLFGTADRLLEQGEEFIAKSKQIGHHSELYLAEGQDHGFFNQPPWLERTIRRADEFLAKLGYLQGEPTVKEGQFEQVSR